MNTHRFRLLTGFAVQVRPLDGRHQTMITKNNHLTFPERLSMVMEDLVDYVGSDKKPDVKFFNNMLAWDRAKLLFELRQFSMDFQKEFEFSVDFEDPKTGSKKPHKVSRTLEYENEEGEMVEGLPHKPYKGLLFDEEDSYKDKIIGDQSTLGAKYVFITLPKIKDVIRFTMYDGNGEILAAKTKKKEASSKTLLDMRFIKKLHKGETSDMYIDVDHEKYGILDLAYLREQIREHEGRLDSETLVKNPFDETEEVPVNILTNLSFFFPGGVV